MLSGAINRWLTEYKSLTESQVGTYAQSVRSNEQLIDELLFLFEDSSALSSEVIDPVCHQLFDFYRSLNIELQRFTLELVPSLIWTYLQALSNNEKKKCGGIEACLLGIYNLEVVDRDGRAKVKQITIPTLACASIYHEPPSLASLALTESALMRYHSDKPVVVSVGPLPHVENISAQNRFPVLSYVLSRYNADISYLSAQSRQFLCQICSRVTRSGFDSLDNELCNGEVSNGAPLSRAPKRVISFVDGNRIPVSSSFLIELLTTVYYSLFNGHAREARRALDDIHFRASYELYSEVVLVTNAIRNSLEVNPSGEPMEGPMGISIALSPARGNPAFNKDAITNASFRAKRLPEDIELVQDDSGSKPHADTTLTIDEAPENDSSQLRPMSSSDATTDRKSSPVMKSTTSKSSGGGPLKSIMKKRDKEKVINRKESDVSANSLPTPPPATLGGNVGGIRASHFKELLLGDIQQQRSPKHSASATAIAAAATAVGNGSEMIDGSAVHLHIIRSNSNRAVSTEHPDNNKSGSSGTRTSDGATLFSSPDEGGGWQQSSNHSKNASSLNGPDFSSFDRPVDCRVQGIVDDDNDDDDETIDNTQL